MTTRRPRIAALYPYDPTSLARIRSLDTLRVLSVIGEVTVFAPDLSPEALAALSKMGCKTVSRRDSLFKRATRIMAAVLTGRSITFAYYRPVWPGASEWTDFDLVFSERCPVPLMINLPPVVVDVVDNFEKQVQQLAKSARPPRRYGYAYDARVIRRDILRLCSTARLVLCTTPLEVDGLRAIGVPAEKLMPYLHLSQVGGSHKPTDSADSTMSRERLAVFHGRANYPANQAAAARLKELAVLTRQWSFLVFGEGWQPGQEANVEYRGFQHDLQLLDSCALGIYPVEVAVGVQNKVLEALSAGLPVLVTPQVHEGLPAAIKTNLSHRIHVHPLRDFATVLNGPERFCRSREAADEFRLAYARVIDEARSRLTEALAPLLMQAENVAVS